MTMKVMLKCVLRGLLEMGIILGHISITGFSFHLLLQDRESYWKMMHKYVGSDITSMVTLPVLIFEPMTMLQKMAEVCIIFTVCYA